MKNSIEAKNYRYIDLLSDGSRIHIIPTLQRSYTWEIKNVERLLDDIIENEEGYYIGSLVVVAGSGSTSRDEIIDGQQRLTTLALILISIRKYIEGNEKYIDIEEEIWDMLMKTRRRGGDEIRLQFTDKSSDLVFSSLANNITPNIETELQGRFVKNANRIEEKIKDLISEKGESAIDGLFKKICSLQTIFIKCEDKTAAYKLFESINSTGENLASTDMIKNAIFQSLNGDKVLEDIEEEWSSMFQLFDEKSKLLKTFIRHHWISKYGYTSHARLYEDFQKTVSTKKQKIDYCKSLFESADIYKKLRDAKLDEIKKLPNKRFERDEIKETLEFLSFLGVDQVYAPLLALYNNQPEDFRRDLIKFSAFQFIYKYIPGSPSAIEKIFADYSLNKTPKEKIFESLKKKCRNQKEEFIKNFLEKTFYKETKSGDVQFILERYMYYIDGQATFSKPTIEHIISKKLKNEDSKDFKKIQNPKKNIHSIGNLLILEKEENGSQNDNLYTEKRSVYQNSVFRSVSNVTTYCFDTDPVDAIKKRGEDMAADIYDFFLKALDKGTWSIKK